MQFSEDILRRVTTEVLATLRGEPEPIPIGVSARHVHLTRAHCDVLFGAGYELTVYRELYQPGFYAANESVTLVSTRRALHNVRILFPLRDHSQVEIARSDAFMLGVDPPLRLSGDVPGTPGITLVGPQGSLHLDQGLIIAARHVHMDPEAARRFGIKHGDEIEVDIGGPRGARLRHVAVRVSEGILLEMHLDTDEANAADVAQGVVARIVK
jgi:putative phosphotransacetylase